MQSVTTANEHKKLASKKFKKTQVIIKDIRENSSIYLMFLPAMVLLFLFSYLPLSGLVIAFKDVNFSKGIWGSNWSTPIFNNFNFLFSSGSAINAFKNTIVLNSGFIIVGLIFEVGLALLLNEIGNKTYRKITQSVTLLPHFVSWIVVGVFAYNLFSTQNGVLNHVLTGLGFQNVEWYNEAEIWPFILTIINRWKITGYGAIIYFAVISGIDASYYEAAEIDRATKWQKIWHITLPMLAPTMIIMTLLHIGKIMNSDFGMFYAIVGDAPQVFSTTDVIDTFVYRGLKQSGDIGMASAAGFVQSIISFVLVLGSNQIARKIDKQSALF